MENNNFDQSREQKIIKTPEKWGFKDEFKEYLQGRFKKKI